jgi:DNA polymerase-3 subunit delta'
MSFSDIRGQDKPIQILQEHIEHTRLAGSYLFAGEDGIGKKLVAKTLAKALNCENETLDSCDRCISCLKIEKGEHPDVHIIDASTPLISNDEKDTKDSDAIRIGHIRQLQREINLKPYEGRKKVFIIDEAHHLTAAASNAFLKTLEESPGESLIILVSSKPALLFKTIISRCKMLKFHSLPRTKLEEILKKDYLLDSSLAHFLAYFCEGKLGRALKLKDMDILREKNRIIDGLALARKSGVESLLVDDRSQLRSYLNILAGWFRDIYFLKIGMPYEQLINLDRKDELLRLMNRYTTFDLDGILNSLSDALLYLEQNINTKLLLSNLRWSFKG